MKRILSVVLCSLLVGAALLPPVSQAQDPSSTEGTPSFSFFDNIESLGGLGEFAAEGQEMTLAAELRLQEGARTGQLSVKASMAPEWHVYALTQQGGPGPSVLSVQPSEAVELLGPFQPDQAPETRVVEEFDVPLQEHYGEVTWTAPVRLAEGVDPENVGLTVRFDGTLCHDQLGCIPAGGEPTEVAFAGYTAPPQAVADEAATEPGGVEQAAAEPALATRYRADRSHATLEGQVGQQQVAAGQSVQIVLTATTEPPWHVYAYAPRDPEEIAKPTVIAIDQPQGWSAGPVSASSPPIEEVMIPGDPPVRSHKGSVSWSFEVQVPQDAAAGVHTISGLIGYQTCTKTGCDPPTAARFSAQVTVGDSSAEGPVALGFAPARYVEAARLAASVNPPVEAVAGDPAAPSRSVLDLDNLQLSTAGEQRSLAGILLIAFIGGFILNFMPCVLPVIGLKIMSFVQQAGESRGKVFALNVWYSLGLISVFMVLATLAAVWSFGWGEQFNFDAFNIVMVAVVFTMGLSFLGVWEIPIPGFVGSGSAQDLARKEGPLGAFAKGAITTLLATPCSGPGLAVALAWCAGKPAPLVYTVFGVMGLGMAAPYLVIGANPGLARFIPKPGAWMETFKQLMGFVLLGTVVYILTFVEWSNVVPTLALLFGLWAACWWIGRTSITADWQVRVRAWAGAVAFATLIGLFAFGDYFNVGGYRLYGLQGIMEYRLAAHVDRQVQKRLEGLEVADAPQAAPAEDQGYELPWQPFSEERLQQLVAANKTVMVDFTASWCLTCKFLERTVLNTREIREVVDQNEVVPLVADWTDRDPNMGKLLAALGSKQVPVLAIFPAGRPNEPIVLLGGYTKQTLIDRLQAAGPSAGAQAPTERVVRAGG